MPPKKRNPNARHRVSTIHTVQRLEPRTRKQHAIADCKIFMLNDDCLLEIFSHLPTIDLCAVKDLCRRFNAMVESIVEKRWKGRAFDCGYADGRTERENTIIVQHFGHFIQNVMILKQEVVYPVKKTGAKKRWIQLANYTALKKLTMFDNNVNRLPICHVKKNLQHLESLDLSGCVGTDSEFAHIINACKNLKNLRIEHGASIFLLTSICHESSNIESLNFAPMNKLSPCSSEFRNGVNEITFGENLAKLYKLQKLKRLTMVCDKFPVSAGIAPLAQKTSLEFINLFLVRSDVDLLRAFDGWAVAKMREHWCWKETAIYELHRHSPTIPTINLS